jgi:D-glycero-alpha-D-manno-heptose 1-phosphate guanylyltransferase
MECIVLAGGLGTRLQGVIGNYPKCMAEIDGRPFLHYIFEYLEEQSCNRVILSLGFQHEVIIEWLKTQSRSFPIDYVIEDVPLGTGGGVSLALKKANEAHVFVLNGDTMFQVDLSDMLACHKNIGAEITIALKRMKNFDRYGVVKTDEKNYICQFEEKKYMADGWINGGIYCINRKKFSVKAFPEKYSFEKDYLEKFISEQMFFGYRSEAYFIDIGIPEDYARAQEDFKQLFS